MSHPPQDCPPNICETPFSVTAAWIRWTQAELFPALLCSAAPCRFDISFRPLENLYSTSSSFSFLLFINSLQHFTTNTDSYRAMLTLVSSENKATCLLCHVQLCLGFCLATQRASVFCHICIHFTLLWKQYHKDTMSFDCVYGCVADSYHTQWFFHALCQMFWWFYYLCCHRNKSALHKSLV